MFQGTLDERCDKCSGCPVLRDAPLYRKDVISRPIAIVIDSPSTLEQAKHVALAGDSGGLARTVLAGCGVKPDECYVTTALNCRPQAKKEKILKNAMLSCAPRLVQELLDSGVEKVLCLGSVGLSQLLGSTRVLPITKVRGRWENAHGLDILATFNPGWMFGETDYFRDFVDDIWKFCNTEPEPPPNIEMWYPQTVAEMWEAFDEISYASFLSCDIETTGVNVFSDEILAVGFGSLLQDSNDGLSVVLRQDILEAEDTWEQISAAIADPNQATIFHNRKFDQKFIRRELLKLGLPYDPHHCEDTMLLHYTVDERPMGRFQSHSLKNMARVRCDAPDYDIGMGKWLKEYLSNKTSEERRTQMRSDMHEYLALDVYYTARMYPDLVNEVMEEDPALMDHYQNTLQPFTDALIEVESHGALVDIEYFKDQWEKLNDKAAPILDRIREYTEIPEFNPNSPKQVADFLYGTLELPVYRTARRGKLQEGKTSKAVLKILKKRRPEYTDFVNDIIQYRNLVKNAGTYVKGILQRVDDDGRIRGDFLPHGTSTGRISSTNPNLQNIPDSSHTGIEIRNGYIAPEGKLLFNADYSQLELRVAAHLSRDENFTQVYREGRDLHQEVVYALYGTNKEETTSYMRYLAKCMSFGALYRRGPESLANGPEMDMVEEEFGGTRWTVDEAREFFEKWFSNFPGFEEWARDIAKFGYKNQYVQTPFGNRRRFPFIPRNDDGTVERQAINTPIQGTAALITVSAFTRIHKRFKKLNQREQEEVAHLTITVHDSIMGEFNPMYLDEVEHIVVDEMENNCPIEFTVPLKADFEFAPNWGIIKDWAAPENFAAVFVPDVEGK